MFVDARISLTLVATNVPRGSSFLIQDRAVDESVQTCGMSKLSLLQTDKDVLQCNMLTVPIAELLFYSGHPLLTLLAPAEHRQGLLHLAHFSYTPLQHKMPGLYFRMCVGFASQFCLVVKHNWEVSHLVALENFSPT